MECDILICDNELVLKVIVYVNQGAMVSEQFLYLAGAVETNGV